jgi:LmbE family N-acetylglucosaminyl deacetylase
VIGFNFRNDKVDVFIPDDCMAGPALERTTHLSIAAHPDDLEIMSYQAIAACYKKEHEWFSGFVVTDGSGSPRGGDFKSCSLQQLAAARAYEQKQAARIGEYGSLVMLNYTSQEVKNDRPHDLVHDLQELIRLARPRVVYTHNLADRHPTHVAVALRTIEALRGLEEPFRPHRLYGCEVWGSLDWLPGEDKVVFDTSLYPDLASSLIKVFESQIGIGKHYDTAVMGRRMANATFSDPHQADEHRSVTFGMDLTPLVEDPKIEIEDYVRRLLERYAKDVLDRMKELT